LQNTVLKTWQGKPENVQISQEALLKRAKANSLAQQGKYDASGEGKEAGAGMYEKGYVYCEFTRIFHVLTECFTMLICAPPFSEAKTFLPSLHLMQDLNFDWSLCILIYVLINFISLCAML
jgi:hypothetical protein